MNKRDQQILATGTKRIRSALLVLRHIQEQKLGATSDDCIVALDIPHQSCSPRVLELEQAGCIQRTGAKRLTSAGGRAWVYKVKSKDFNKYLEFLKTKKAETPSRTPRDKHLVRSCESFLKQWGKPLTPKAKTAALKKLVKNLEGAPS